MSLIRREASEGTSLVESLDRAFLENALRPLESWRHLFDDDTIKVEEFMDDNELVIRAEIPGVDPDRDIDISVADGSLRIQAERREEHTSKGRHMRRAELRYGSFSRAISLPPDVQESDIKATYKDGVLEVRIPVEEQETKPSKIPIKRQ